MSTTRDEPIKATEASSSAGTTLALPPPSEGAEKTTVTANQAFKFDHLGPVIVNRDGTLSRIANWESMTPIEKERTLRILVARNQVRLAEQESQEGTVADDVQEQAKLSISQRP
ncbi:uncharacterized protein TRAVEDRAFT_49139 [Trametes versicolor FP-101664 SS1]|uniref:uncharacterized protein n=1 Tax=Trametes versicolor (strain FP-101664) TaxID=717944 RepID=UPI0004622A05|nr:uncharacterized protein TRAVEDRAFT_49139 [Trametes versicolor FP-101664 SS1]EIW56305.1 hypothetical protein TRAVEDRAFT_49139 [Trametes versicolor FP-101664 SS1]